nr:helix-turn-helix domain-containing protein [Lachnospiraceae bacterium]
MAIGENIRKLRRKQDLTQAALAEKLYVTSQAVSQWERGVTIPDLAKLDEIAAILHTTVNVLVADRDSDRNFSVKDSLSSAEHMFSRMITYAETENLRQTFHALQYMKEKHAGQFRKPSLFSDAKVPYITHPLLMACHAHALRIREDSILAAVLLHDVCEECDVTPAELPVSDEAAEAVALLTYRKDPAADEKAARKAYYSGITGNRIATIVKVLDRCNNISTMAGAFSEERLVAYIKETEEYVMPLLDHARRTIPEYADAFFIIRYHMNSVLESLKSMLLRLT